MCVYAYESQTLSMYGICEENYFLIALFVFVFDFCLFAENFWTHPQCSCLTTSS